jgi:hypothetical protein
MTSEISNRYDTSLQYEVLECNFTVRWTWHWGVIFPLKRGEKYIGMHELHGTELFLRN